MVRVAVKKQRRSSVSGLSVGRVWVSGFSVGQVGDGLDCEPPPSAAVVKVDRVSSPNGGLGGSGGGWLGWEGETGGRGWGGRDGEGVGGGGVVGDYRYNQYQLGLGVRFGRRLAAVY